MGLDRLLIICGSIGCYVMIRLCYIVLGMSYGIIVVQNGRFWALGWNSPTLVENPRGRRAKASARLGPALGSVRPVNFFVRVRLGLCFPKGCYKIVFGRI